MNKKIPTFDFQSRIEALRVQREAPTARIKDITDQYAEWAAEALKASGTFSTAPDPAVETAVAVERRRMADMGRQEYESARAEVTEVMHQHVTRIDAAYLALASAITAFEPFEREHTDYARACGVPVLPSLIDHFIGSSYRVWKDRVAAVLNPPKPMPAPARGMRPFALINRIARALNPTQAATAEN